VQEGLGNIVRHARASHVEIALAFERGGVALSIADDGVGMSEGEPGARVGFGMGNLRQRVDDVGGTLDVRSEPGGGTHIHVSVPIEENA
jgi:signal transduction histidine kinase